MTWLENEHFRKLADWKCWVRAKPVTGNFGWMVHRCQCYSIMLMLWLMTLYYLDLLQCVCVFLVTEIINFCTLWAYWFYDISRHMHLWIKSKLLMHSWCLRCFLMHGKLKKIYFFSIAPYFFVSWIHCHHLLTVPNQLQLLLFSATGSHCRSVPVTAAPKLAWEPDLLWCFDDE